MTNTTDPCKFCSDYPHHYLGICAQKMKYINQIDEDTEIVKRKLGKKKRVFSNDFNKNGIRRS